MIYSPNPRINATIEALLAIGCPPIPVAPKQDPRKEWCHRVVTTKDGAKYCPVDKTLNPIPRFTGKNPSYLNRDGIARICLHGEFQTRLPTGAELKEFFCHPDTGIGTLGGHARVWIDFDKKCYDSQQECDRDVERIISENNLQSSWIERTGSGGWRIAVRPAKTPTYTNFATSPDGNHVGEALFEGRFTVLAPSIHPNGNSYQRTGWGTPIEVESLEAIGIYPSKDEVEQATRKREQRKATNSNYGKPTNPQDNPWDIRNFAHYFEGYHERGDGWAAAKCPHHNGTSQTSFRVNLDTGEYKLWCGCNTKDVYKSGLALATAQGYTTARQSLDNPITQDEWELKFGFGRRLRERIKLTLNGFKGFGKAPSPQLKPKEAPDQLFQDANQRLTTWQDGVNLGYKYILDSSAPSLGKSHAAGIALPEAFEADKLWYVSNDHRNPTTGVIETNYVDLPVRHNGMVADHSRKTPNGNPFVRHPQNGEEPDTQGNCPKTDLFHKFRAKNLNVEASESSPICQSCNLAHLCKSGNGQNYGASFRGDRKNALSHPRIRAHADSMPSPGAFDYSSSGIIWDEVGTQLKPMDSVTVTLTDFDQSWAELEQKAPNLHEQLKSLRLALRPLLTGELKQPYHGFDDASIRAMLPETPSNLDVIVTELESVLQPDLSFLDQQADMVSADDARKLGISKAQQQLTNRYFRRRAHEEFSQGFQQLALNWLIPFLKVWNGERGAIRCERQQLTIFTKSDRHTSVAQAAKFNIFLDGTISRERLALLLGVAPDEIYVVQQSVPQHGNLKIIQVTGMGKLGKDRSESLNDRVAALKSALPLNYPGIIFGDWKKHTSTGDGQWFVDLRGSNQFQNAPALAGFGVPYQNVGYLSCLYQTLTGEYAALDKEHSHPGLQRFIEDTTQAEIEQAVGRLRSHVRPNEQLTFIFVGDYDLSFLGLPIEQIEAFQICPQAGTSTQITRWKILEAARILNSQGEKLTQNAIAALTGKSQELISKIASVLGGWKRLKKLLLVLLDPLYSDSNNFLDLTDEEKSIAQSYLPLVLDESQEAAVQEIVTVVQVCGISAFLRIVGAATPQTQARLLALVMQALPANFQSELVALIEGSGAT